MVLFLISTLCISCVQAKDHKNLTGMSSWTSGTATLSHGMCFHVPSIMVFGKVMKRFDSVLPKTRNPGFDLSHSLLPLSCAEMFSNLCMSFQAVLTFDPETSGDLLIDMQPQAKKSPPLFLD